MATHGSHSTSGSQLVEMQGTLRLSYPMLPDLGCLLSHMDMNGCIGKVMFQYLPAEMVGLWRKCLSPSRPVRIKIDSFHQLANFEVDGVVTNVTDMPQFSEISLCFHQLTPVQIMMLRQAMITAMGSDAMLPAVQAPPSAAPVEPPRRAEPVERPSSAVPLEPPPPPAPPPAQKVYPVPVSFEPPPLRPNAPPVSAAILRSDVPDYVPPAPPPGTPPLGVPQMNSKPSTILDAFRNPPARPPENGAPQADADASDAARAVPRPSRSRATAMPFTTPPPQPRPASIQPPAAPMPPAAPPSAPSFPPAAPPRAPMPPYAPPQMPPMPQPRQFAPMPPLPGIPADAPPPMHGMQAPQLSQPSQNSAGKKRIGVVLVQMGYISAVQLDDAARQARMKGERIGRYLVRSGMVAPDVMCRALALQSGLPMTDLSDLEVPEELTKIFSYSTMMRHGFVPFDESREMICIAVANPLSPPVMRELEQSSGRKIEVFLGREDLILKHLNKIRSQQQVVPRRFIRYDLHTAVTYQYCTRFGAACEEGPQQGMTVNISEGGLLMEGPASMLGKPDDLLRRGTCVNITIPFTPPVEIHALCRLKAIQERKDGWLIGLEMLDISAEDKRRLKELCVRALLTRIPSRRT